LILGIFLKKVEPMKAPLLITALTLVFGVAPAFSKSELEMLREENRALKAELAQLKGLPQPPAVSHQEVGASKPAAAPKASTYTVVAGDSLARIARRSNCSVKALMAANQLKKTVIHPGQVLKLPGAPRTAPAAMAVTPKANPAVAAKPAPTNEKPKAKDPVASLPTVVSNSAPKAPTTSAIVTSSKQTTPKEEVVETSAPVSVPRITGPILAKRSVIIDAQTTYGDFAAKHQTTAEQLNALNGFSLSPTTVLAKGSEIDVPAQP
jgi:LysM repeat protein